MATDDCYEIARGPCICGKGEIYAERCTPDHPWAKASQVSYNYVIECPICRAEYLAGEGSSTIRLTKKSDHAARDAKTKEWGAIRREIEQSDDFEALRKALDDRLALEKSAAARHRVLVGAGLTFGMPVERYRRDGFTLSPIVAKDAMQLLKFKSAALDKLIAQMEKRWAEGKVPIPDVDTGIKVQIC